MNTSSTIAQGSSQPGAAAADLEGKFGQLAARWLDIAASNPPLGVDQRLRFAREQALAAARHAQIVREQPVRHLVATGAGAAALLQGGSAGTPWWARFASVAPALVLAAGLVAIHNLHQQHRVMAAVEVDSALLADGLPPAAYSDPGFAEFVRQSPQ